MAILLKAIYRLKSPPKFQLNSSLRLKGQFVNSSGKKKNRIAKTILNNKRTTGGITMSDINLYYKAIVIKTAWYWYSDRKVDQWDRIEDPEMNPHTYSHLIFDKRAKSIQWKNDSIFNKWCCLNWQLLCRRMQIDPFFLLYILLFSICTSCISFFFFSLFY